MPSRRPAKTGGVHWTLIATAIVAAILALTGGSSRGDVSFIVVPRLAALILILVLLVGLPTQRFNAAARVLAAGTLSALVIAIQLIPLPPSWWAALPGHTPYALLADPAVGARWRPISLTPDLSWESLVALLPPIALGMAAAATRGAQRRWWIYGLLGLAGLSAVLGLVQLADGPDSALRWYPITSQFAAVGLFANRNHNGVFLALAIPFVTVLARSRVRLLRRGQAPEPIVFGTLAAILGLAAMAVATGSRFASAAALTAMVLTPLQFIAPPRPSITWRASVRIRFFIVVAAAGVFAIAAALVMLSGSGLARVTSEGLDDQVRSSILPSLFQMARDFTPFGSGFGSFASVFRNYEPFDQMRLTYLNAAHNDLMQLIIEGGLPAIALLVAYLVGVMRGTVTAWRRSGDELARAASIGIWLLLAASLFDYPLRTPLLSSLLAVLTVWLLAQPPEDDALPRGTGHLGTNQRDA
jgi:hypothetical protein